MITTKIIQVITTSKFFLEKVWGTFTHLDRTFVSSVFLVIVCVAPLILKRGFHFGHTLVGDTRALRGCGFFGASVCLLRVGCFFLPLLNVAGSYAVNRGGWGRSCPLLVLAFLLCAVCFGKSCQ